MAERQEHPGQPQATLVATPPGTVADIFKEVFTDIELTPYQTAGDVAIFVRREDLPRVMQAAKEDPRLALDYLRCLSGVDTYQDLQVVYHLYSFRHKHSVQIAASCPYDDPHLPTVSHLWQTANWHERETAELFGIIFDGHPDLRPLLTEEGLGYYVLRKSHPLAEIEEWQEDYLKLAVEAESKTKAAAVGAPAEVDERAAKVALAQKKAAVIKKAREEARAKGLPMEEEKAFVQAALRAFEAEQEKLAPAAPAPATAPAEDRAAKIALAQKKAGVIKKAREEARAKGLSMEEERAFVQAALKALEAEMGVAAAPAPPPPAAAPSAPTMDRAAKVALAQKKAAVIKRAREEARARGMSSEEERRFVAEALKRFVEEQGEG